MINSPGPHLRIQLPDTVPFSNHSSSTYPAPFQYEFVCFQYFSNTSESARQSIEQRRIAGFSSSLFFNFKPNLSPIKLIYTSYMYLLYQNLRHIYIRNAMQFTLSCKLIDNNCQGWNDQRRTSYENK